MTQVQIYINTREIVGHGDYIPDPPDDNLVVCDLATSEETKLRHPGRKILEQDGTITVFPPSPDALTLPTSSPSELTIGEHVDNEQKIRIAYDLRSYFDNPEPTHEFTVATLKTLIRLVLN